MTSPSATATADETSIKYSGWPVVGVCFLIATFAWSAGLYGQGVYLAELQRVHGWQVSQISTAATCYYLFSSILVVFVSEAMRKFGPRLCLSIGVCALAAGTASMAWITSPVQLYAAYAVIAFGWAGTSLAARGRERRTKPATPSVVHCSGDFSCRRDWILLASRGIGSLVAAHGCASSAGIGSRRE